MQTIPVRLYAELKDDIDEAIRQYRKHTGENISFSEMVTLLINDDEMKDIIRWEHKSYK